jgi:FMN-dependent NADH-azoreductase
MKEILWLSCSPRGAAANSYRAGTEMIAAIRRKHPDVQVKGRDLTADPVPFIDVAYTANMLKDQKAAQGEPSLKISESLIEELVGVDALVISTPMHNFTVPAPLKAWIDQVLRINRTFVRTPRGKEGLLADRPVFVLVSAGGGVRGDDPGQPDFLTPYLQAVLGTIGLKDVTFFYLEKLGGGDVPPDRVFEDLRGEIDSDLMARATANLSL